MNAVSKMKSGVLATALLVSFAVMAPQAQAAYHCTGNSTVTIKYDGKYFWYIQSGKVCGNRLA